MAVSVRGQALETKTIEDPKRPNIIIEVTNNDSFYRSQQPPVAAVYVQQDPTCGVRTMTTVMPMNQTQARSLNSSQSLTVQSGEMGYIFVGDRVPYTQSFVVGPGQVFNSTVWRDVGTRLAVRPTAVGDMIRLEVYPEISAQVEGQPQVFSYSEYGTTVTIKNGSTAQIGGFAQASSAFNKGFFGAGSRQGQSFGQGVTVRARIEGSNIPSHRLDEMKPKMYKAPAATQ